MPVVQIQNLTKSYGHVRALSGVDMNVEQGEVLGFIGPNGAGKTTTIRILLGLLRKDGGAARLLGRDAWTEAVAVHRHLAYVPGEVQLWPNLSGGEVIDLLGRLRGGLVQSRRAELLRRFDLDPTKLCGTYSKGNRQKVGLIAAFASDVDLYILDEPSSGLDPLMATVFQGCVAGLKRAGKTVLMSSHILADVEKLCDRVVIIRNGRIVESGTLDEMRHLTRVSVSAETERPVTGLDGFPGVHNLAVDSLDGLHVAFQVETNSLGAVMKRLAEAGIRALTSAPPTLEELFMRHYDADLKKNGPEDAAEDSGRVPA